MIAPFLRLVFALAGAAAVSGCTTTSIALSAAGVATDTSIPLAIAKHVHAKITEGDPVACRNLTSVQRALSARCGAFVPGSIEAKDIARSGLQVCPLSVAVREPQFWPVLPELLDKGAQPEACAVSPLVELAQANPCPDFAAASPATKRALTFLAESDARAVRHDVVRMLSCPKAREAGLDHVLVTWADAGALQPGALGFGALGALHPSYLGSGFAQRLEAAGHTARAGIGSHDGRLAGGFEEALRTSDYAALDWWFTRVPELAKSVPPAQGSQHPWIPLARVLVPSFLAQPAEQPRMVEYLLARGANPRQRMPFDAGQTVIGYARTLHSPAALVAMMEAPPAPALPSTTRLALTASKVPLPTE